MSVINYGTVKIEYSTSTKIKILMILNDVGKYYTVLCDKSRKLCVYFHCCNAYTLHTWENVRWKYTKMLIIIIYGW